MYLKKLMDAVQDFHDKMGISEARDFPTTQLDVPDLCVQAMEDVKYIAEDIERDGLLGEADGRWLRHHLHLEESHELWEAINAGDKHRTLDAICDLIYVLVGTALMFRLPLDKGMQAVHNSNMTKTPRQGPRLRDKGGEFVPVNWDEVFG